MAGRANEDRSDAKTRIEQMNSVVRDLLRSQSASLGNSSLSRNVELTVLQNRFNDAIQMDGQNLYKAKSPSQNVYDYMANAILGYNNVERRGDGFQMKTGNPSRDAWLNKERLERLFTTGDTQMASYFATTNSDIAHIYDEIDSVCAYFYQLLEARDAFRDNIFSAEQPGTSITYDVNFPTVTDVDILADYRAQVDQAFKYMNYEKKLRDHLGPKTLQYGTYYLMITPYAEVGAKMATGALHTISGGTSMGRPIFESADPKKAMDKEANRKEILEAATELFLSFEEEKPEKDKKGNYILPEALERRLEIIADNLNNLIVNEDPTPANVTGLKQGVYESMDPELQKMVDDAIVHQRNKHKDAFKSTIEGKKETSEVISSKEIDNIQGCDLRLVDPRSMVPIKIFDYTFGYYYSENYEFARMGTTLTDIMSNQMNFTERTLVVDRLVNAVLKNLKYKDLVEGNQTLRTMILNCVLYAERRDSPIRIKFVPAEYVVAYNVNTDENGNGQPIFLRSLFYARLYTSLLLFNITAIITKSTDSEFYYLRETELDGQFSNQASDLMDQFQNNNIDLMRIADGDLLHGNRAINKRYYLSLGTSDQRPVDMEVVSGQQIDIHNDFMNDLKKMAIGSTGEPSVMVDFMDEVEYATGFGMVNIRFMKRCNNYSSDFDPSITDSIRLILKYNGSSIPMDDLEKMEIVLRKHKIINNNITAQELNDTIGVAQSMIDTWVGGADTNPPEDQAFIKEYMLKDVVMSMTSGVPWEILQDSYNRGIVYARKKALEQQIRAKRLEDGSADSSGEGGDMSGAY